MPVDVESLYRMYGPLVLRRCRKLMREEASAVDAMHDVFVELLRRRDGLDDRAPVAFLLTIATNVCLNRLRGRRRHPEDADDETLMRIVAETDVEERSLARRMLDRLFAREPTSTRTIAVLHYIDRLTLDEVADQVGMSVSGVRWRLRTLQERLALGQGGNP